MSTAAILDMHMERSKPICSRLQGVCQGKVLWWRWRDGVEGIHYLQRQHRVPGSRLVIPA